MLRARSLLSRMFVSCSYVDLDLIGSRWVDPLHGMSCFPFYKPRESVGYNGGKGEERERGRLPGPPGPSPSCGSRRPCRCQQGWLHIVALSVTGAMHRRHLPVMALHSVPADVVVN